MKQKLKKGNQKLNPEPVILFAAGLVKKKSASHPHTTKIVHSGGGDRAGLHNRRLEENL